MASLKVLVIGGAGYVGSTLVNHMLARGNEVRVLDLARGDHLVQAYESNARFEYIQGDFGNEASLTLAFQDVDATVHLAALVGYPACDANPELAERTNVAAVKTLVEHLPSNHKLVFASTGSVYGAVPEGLCTETTRCEPLSLYGRTKLLGEQIALSTDQAVVLRFSTAFGVGRITRLDLLLHQLTVTAIQERRLEIFEPHASRSFVHVKDMSRSIAFALDHWSMTRGGVFNVGNAAANLTKGELAQMIAARTDSEVSGMVGHDKDMRDYQVDFSRIEELGFGATVPVEEGITEIVKMVGMVSTEALRGRDRVEVPNWPA